MKSRDNLLRLKHFQVEDKTRQLTQIEMMIGEFTQMATELDRQIQMEEEKSGITDTTHFAYPTFAKAARQRRDNLEGSIKELMVQKEGAEEALANAEEELKKAQMLDNRGGGSANDPVVDAQVENRALIG
ncbi:MAG: flagellar export protein FliJ [Pseudomonadota bacterium]